MCSVGKFDLSMALSLTDVHLRGMGQNTGEQCGLCFAFLQFQIKSENAAVLKNDLSPSQMVSEGI